MVGRKGVDGARRELSWYLYEIRAALEIRFNDQQTASRVWASTTTNTFLLQILQRFFTFASTLIAFQLRPFITHLYATAMAPKPASTASKAPHSTAASKAPAKTTEGKKAAKKTSKAPVADGEKKKRKKTRKETYSSYIYKG